MSPGMELSVKRKLEHTQGNNQGEACRAKKDLKDDKESQFFSSSLPPPFFFLQFNKKLTQLAPTTLGARTTTLGMFILSPCPQGKLHTEGTFLGRKVIWGFHPPNFLEALERHNWTHQGHFRFVSTTSKLVLWYHKRSVWCLGWDWPWSAGFPSIYWNILHHLMVVVTIYGKWHCTTLLLHQGVLASVAILMFP